MTMAKVGLLTVSDRAASGTYEDRSGPLMAERIGLETDWIISERAIFADEQEGIARTLREWSQKGTNLILTSGGTGFAPRDITPEATRQVIDREAPGIAEALRAESLRITRHAMLSRGVAGICGRTLIINLPGSPTAVSECLDILLPVLPHALKLLAEEPQSDSGHREV